MTTPVCTGSSGGAATTGHAPHTPYPAHTPHTTGHGSHSRPGPQSAHVPRAARTPYASRTPYAPYPSFSSFVRARGPVLLRAARSLTANPSDAEDLLQTALTKTYVAWERIEDHRALDGYVRRALLNTRTSQWRKRKVDEFACDELPEQEAAPAPDPAEQQTLRDAMWRAVLKLPDRQRAMVVLRYYEDLSEAQTAEVLGVSIGTVKSAVSRALGKLREDPELAPVR
ncbi:SigE family RNA polymerase sigma factor [Streptomyces sp. NBC_01591]|uniref:SigE family RNA polymerase sigma factor n=1 Tax=Streptomyces sp. NBC_01591 TaxID=2975888 RepID=UPI002DD9320F|nr:SigE family RNA polymerase sigma factor [Streptomyces sp. NBC_01591]WSD69657.1 SigE family RNA polymerase sigma factor [Streptomyces sp. NBC_01591]